MEARLQKQISARKLTILLLLAAPGTNTAVPKPILGITRMQKLVFLVSDKMRQTLKGNTYFTFDYNYEPEKYGPADLDLYQDIEFLTAMKLISCNDDGVPMPSSEPSLDNIIAQSSKKRPIMLPEERAEEELSFEYLMGVAPSELITADLDPETESEYSITEKGMRLLENLDNNSQGRQKELFTALRNTCESIRRGFGDWNLRRLLKYVYENYSSLTTNSLIREKIIGKR